MTFHKSNNSPKWPFTINVTLSDIGFAAFGVTGRAVIDFALLTSQARLSIRAWMIKGCLHVDAIISMPSFCECFVIILLAFIPSDWVLLCLPHIHIGKSCDLFTSESIPLIKIICKLLNFFLLNVVNQNIWLNFKLEVVDRFSSQCSQWRRPPGCSSSSPFSSSSHLSRISASLQYLGCSRLYNPNPK